MRNPATALDLSLIDTWPKVLAHNNVVRSARATAIRYKHYGIWQSYSWQDYYSNVKYLALGLLSLGFEPGGRLLIVGDNSPEWYFAQLAAQCDRGISVGLYSAMSATEIERVATDCGATFAMVEDEEQVDKILQIRDRLPALKTVIYWRFKGLGKQRDAMLFGLRQVLERGRMYEQEHQGVFEQNVAAGKADDVCAIVYTSGTTRDCPKGTVHSQRSLMTSAQYYREQGGLRAKDDLACYLPPAWITEQWLAVGCHLLCGGTLNFPESPETQQEDIREIAPRLLVYSSRVWENLAGQIQAKMRGASFLKRLATRWLLPVGYKTADLAYTRRRPSPYLGLLGLLGNLMVFRPIRDSLGLTRARVCYTSGSALSPDVLRLFHALNVPLRNIYGSAEAGAITGASDKTQSPATVGSINQGVEVKVTEEGEIAVRHPGVFLGYHGDPETTDRVARAGWVYTGDKGHLTAEGELVFEDRLEDMITLPCGDVMAPQYIESRLKYGPYIRDAWVLARKDCEYLSAVIIIDAANIGRWADKRKVTYTTFGDLSQKPEVYRLVEEEIVRTNRDLPESLRVRKYVNLHKEFDADECELTRNHKLRRAFLTKTYPDLVEALSADRETVQVETEFTYQDGRTGKLRTSLQIATIGEDDQ